MQIKQLDEPSGNNHKRDVFKHHRIDDYTEKQNINNNKIDTELGIAFPGYFTFLISVNEIEADTTGHKINQDNNVDQFNHL
jgi:hypothetical protein